MAVEVGHYLAAATKVRIQGAVAVEALNGEVIARDSRQGSEARDDDFSVRLHRQCRHLVDLVAVGDDVQLAAAAKGGVDGTVGVVATQRQTAERQ